jgi:hypothetical protein
MRRFFLMAAFALGAVLVATPANAGYLIIRVLFEGSGGADDNDLSGAGPGLPRGGYGGLMSPGPGKGGVNPGYGKGGMSPGPGGKGGGRPMAPPRDPSGGGMGDPGTPGVAAPIPHDPARSVVVVIPVRNDLTAPANMDPKRPGHLDNNPRWPAVLKLNHRGQQIRTSLFTDSSTVQWYENFMKTPRYMRTHDLDLEEAHARWAKNKTDSMLAFQVIRAALQSGYVDLAVTYSDELIAAVGDKADGLPAEVATFVKTYKAMQSGIKGGAQKPGKARYWKEMLGARDVHESGHYAIVYWDTPTDEVQRRAAILEENYRAFYLLHAMRGVELPTPDSPLVVVLAKQAANVRTLAGALDAAATLRADGAYSVEHDVLVLSPERLDGVGQTFLRQNQQIYREGISRDSLLAGGGPKISAQGMPGGKKPDEVAWMQTMALVERIAEDNAAQYTASREGSRQLLYRTGQLPRYVQLPQWLSTGAVSVYTRPRDPAYVKKDVKDKDKNKEKWYMAVATTTGYGIPNYTLQRYLRDLEEKKELHTDRAQLLRNVLNDAYFNGLRDPREANDPDPRKVENAGIALNTGTGGPAAGGNPGYGVGSPMPPMGGTGGGLSLLGPPGSSGGLGTAGGTAGGGLAMPVSTEPVEDPVTKLRKARERLQTKADATAWALCYYLTREKPREFRKFVDELAMLPRDLPLDGAVVTQAFFRAFDLDGGNESLRRFADAWMKYMNDQVRVSEDIELIELKPGKGGASPFAPGGGMGGTGPGGTGT